MKRKKEWRHYPFNRYLEDREADSCRVELSGPERSVDEAWMVMRALKDPHRPSVHQPCITSSISAEGSRVAVVLVVT